MPETTPSFYRKLLPVCLCFSVIVAAGYYMWKSAQPQQMEAANVGPEQPRSTQTAQSRTGSGERGERQRRESTPEEGEERRRQMAASLGLTDEQQQQMQALSEPGNREEGRQRFEKMREILTPEQIEKMHAIRREKFQQRFEERFNRMSENLSEADKIELRKRFEIQREEWAERRDRRRAERENGETSDTPGRRKR